MDRFDRREVCKLFLRTSIATAVSTQIFPLSQAIAGGTKIPEKTKLNVLLLLSDDQGPHLECLGTRGISTPAANKLARQGVVFSNAFSTSASCSPARSGILTGMYPHSNGHWRNTHTPEIPGDDKDYSRGSKYAEIEKVGVHEDIPTLVEILNEDGYTTAITQKFHLSPVWKYPFKQRLGCSSGPQSYYQQTKQFFESCEDTPFFMLANITNTHRPFNPHITKTDSLPVDPEAIEVPANLADTSLMRKDLAEYFDMVQSVDASTAAILKALKESGKYDNTLIIFTSDQGYCYHRAKATAYDMGTRVPLIIQGPKIIKNKFRSELVSHIDLVPTILDYLNMPVPSNVQGMSLRPLLEQSSTVKWRKYVFTEHNSHGPNPAEYYPIRTVFDGRFHYIRNFLYTKKWKGDLKELLTASPLPAEVQFAGPADVFPGKAWDNKSYKATLDAKDEFPLQYQLLEQIFNRPQEELYDLHTDPYEMFNIAQEDQNKKIMNELRLAVDDWMKETKDPGLKLNQTPRRM